MTDKPKRGGRRPGAGRKPDPNTEPLEPISARLPESAVEFLKSQGLTQTLRNLVFRSREFRDWQKKKIENLSKLD